MKKNLTRVGSVLLVVLLSFNLVACGSDKKETETPTNADELKNTEAEKDVEQDAAMNEHASLTDVVEAIKEAYGEKYYPNMIVEKEMLETTYGLKEDMYDEIYAETPMISAQVDFLIAVKVKEGKQEEVVDALNAYKEYLNKDSLQYPSNVSKIAGIQLVEKGGFVFLYTLGGALESDVELSESAALEKVEEMNSVAKEVIDQYLE